MKYSKNDKVVIICQCEFCKRHDYTGKTATISRIDNNYSLTLNGYDIGDYHSHQIKPIETHNRNGANS